MATPTADKSAPNDMRIVFANAVKELYGGGTISHPPTHLWKRNVPPEKNQRYAEDYPNNLFHFKPSFNFFRCVIPLKR